MESTGKMIVKLSLGPIHWGGDWGSESEGDRLIKVAQKGPIDLDHEGTD